MEHLICGTNFEDEEEEEEEKNRRGKINLIVKIFYLII